MQYFGAEISHFSRFSEGKAFYAMAAWNDARIGGKHAVNIGPDLDFFRADPCADNRSRVIGTATAKRGRVAVLGRADETTHDDNRNPGAAGTTVSFSAA